MEPIRVVESGKPDWLPAREWDPSEPGWRVGDCLPAGYGAYLRLFHPFIRWDVDPEQAGPEDRQTWRALAEKVGLELHPTLQWDSLEPALPIKDDARPYSVAEGELDPHTRQRLFSHLRRHTPPQPTFYLYYLAAMVWGDNPFTIEAALEDMERVAQWIDERHAAEVSTPELVWPQDRRWVVHTDYDLDSTYIAADTALATDLLADPMLETIAVDLATRVDYRADADMRSE